MITNILNIIKSNAPSILTGMAIFGTCYAAVEAVKATPKAMRVLEEHDVDPRKQPKEAAKLAGKYYIFPAGILAVTIVCIAGANLLQEKDKSKLVAALAYSEYQRKNYRDSAKKIFGEQAETIDQDAVEKQMKNNAMPSEPAAKGLVWCYEPESDQWFQTSTEEILWVELTANKMFANHGQLTFNQFLNLFKNAKKVEFGDHFGWYIYDEDGAWDFNWSFYPGGTPWIDIQPMIDQDRDCFILAYGMHPGDDLDCHDVDIDEPEQFEVK